MSVFKVVIQLKCKLVGEFSMILNNSIPKKKLKDFLLKKNDFPPYQMNLKPGLVSEFIH